MALRASTVRNGGPITLLRAAYSSQAPSMDSISLPTRRRRNPDTGRSVLREGGRRPTQRVTPVSRYSAGLPNRTSSREQEAFLVLSPAVDAVS